MQTATTLQQGIRAGALPRRLPALVTIGFGLFVLYFVGFSTITVLHNGAHDARHANGFPCH